MIPYKNIFCGSLGKTKKPGGSPFMTTPHTRLLIEPDYSIETGVSGEFVCCTLNGRLWVYKTGEGQYSFVALKWDEAEGQLELAATDTLSGSDTPLVRGIDWIMLDNQVIQVIDEAPYILKAELFYRTQGGRFCYSLLRSQVLAEKPTGMSVTLGPGIDPFTLKAWGLGTDNGNTEGWGYFSVNLTGLYPKGTHIMEACYSTLPSVGDWNIVEDFIVSRPISLLETPSNAFFKQIRPLIPLEFNWYSQNVSYPTYGTGYSTERRGIQVSAYGSQLWGRGLMHLGRAYILPAAFDEAGQPQEFYLYIGAEGGLEPYNLAKNSNLDKSDPWLTVGVAGLKDSSNQEDGKTESTFMPIGFFSEKGNPITGGVCQTAISAEVLVGGKWINPRPEDEGKIAFDAMNGSALALGKSGVTFLQGDVENNTLASGGDYSCQGMSEWLAPAGQLDGIAQDRILSSFDNGLLMTNIPTGFDRLLLSPAALPLTWGAFEKKDTETGKSLSQVQLSISSGPGQLSVTELPCSGDDVPVSNIPWEEVYLQAVNIRLLNYIEGMEIEGFGDTGPLIISKRDVQEKEKYDSWYGEYFSWPVRAHYEFYFIHPDTGALTPGTVDIDLTPYYDYEPDPERADGVDYVQPYFPTVDENGVLGVRLQRYIHYRVYGGPTYDGGTVFIPLSNLLPDWWDSTWDAYGNPGLKLERKLYLPSSVVPVAWNTTKGKVTLPPESPCYPHLVFTEASSGTKFLMKSPSFGSLSEDWSATGLLNDLLNRDEDVDFSISARTYTSSTVKDCWGKDKGSKTLHIWSTCNYTWDYDYETDKTTVTRFNNRLFVIRADLDPDVFDFDAELAKAKLF